MGWARLVAVVASSSLLSCGLVFPTDDLVAGDGGPNGGTVLCAGDGSTLEATTDQKGAIFLLQNITKGASCPAPPAQSTTSQIVGCVVFVI
jgi:hypothetical protein